MLIRTTVSKPHTPVLNRTQPISEVDEQSDTHHQTKVRPSSADAIHRDTTLNSTPRRSSGSIHHALDTPTQRSSSRSSTKRPPLVRDATLSGSLECLLDAVSTNDGVGWDRGLMKSTSLHSIDSVESRQRDSVSDIELGDISLETVDPEETLKPARVQLLKDRTENGLSTKHESLQNIFDRHNEYSFVHSNDGHTPHKHSNGYHGDSTLHNTPPVVTHKNSQKMTDDQSSSTTMQATPEHNTTTHSTPNVLQSLPVLHPRRPSFSPRVGRFLKHTISVPSINFHRERRMTPDVPKMRIIQLEKSSNPIDVLQRYQFLSLGCSSGSENLSQLRRLLTEGRRNSEAQNYKLSYEREPN